VIFTECQSGNAWCGVQDTSKQRAHEIRGRALSTKRNPRNSNDRQFRGNDITGPEKHFKIKKVEAEEPSTQEVPLYTEEER